MDAFAIFFCLIYLCLLWFFLIPETIRIYKIVYPSKDVEQIDTTDWTDEQKYSFWSSTQDVAEPYPRHVPVFDENGKRQYDESGKGITRIINDPFHNYTKNGGSEF